MPPKYKALCFIFLLIIVFLRWICRDALAGWPGFDGDVTMRRLLRYCTNRRYLRHNVRVASVWSPSMTFPLLKYCCTEVITWPGR